VTVAEGGHPADHLPQRLGRHALALELGVHAPSGLVGGHAVVVDLPPADAAGGRAVDVDAEHVGQSGFPQPQVPVVSLLQLFGRLRAAQLRGHVRRVAPLQHGHVIR